MTCASVYKVTILKSIFIHHKNTSWVLSSHISFLAASLHACRAEARELMCPWASNRRSLPDKIKPTVLVVNIVFCFFLPSNEPCMQGKKNNNKETTFNYTQMLPSHPSEYDYTPQQTHTFAQCEFTLITQAASAIGREETVRGI